jgi:triphosphoribosyl-dephospho-CoA synthase
MTYVDFAVSAVAIAPAMDAATKVSLGQTVLDAVRATRQVVHKNTNLGTVLLLAPLAKVPREQPLKSGVAEVLGGMDSADAAAVYEAIRWAQPGGLGTAPSADVQGTAPPDLVAAMRLAAERDLVARQYVNNFAEVLDFVVPRLVAEFARIRGLESIVRVQLELMREFPDSLIARKCGPAVARESANRAAAVLAAGAPGDASYVAALAEFDAWLRADGHCRNPGTTADLLAAGLFAALRDGMIDVRNMVSRNMELSGGE